MSAVKKRKCIGSIFYLLILLAIGCTPQYKYVLDRVDNRNQSSGKLAFRDVELGCNFNDVNGLVVVESRRNGQKFCTRPGDHLQIGDIPLTHIVYVFFKDKLMSVFIQFPCEQFSELKDIISQKYGAGKSVKFSTTTIGSHLWQVGDDGIGLECEPLKDKGSLIFMDVAITESYKAATDGKGSDDL